MKQKNSKSHARTSTPFPPAWLWLVDEAIPLWVKKNYSPRESWKDKPFSTEDGQFFLRGIHELSDLFTDERPKGMPAYFQHPKYRSSYLLYFLPLQAAKFLTLFQLHPAAVEAALSHAKKTGVLRIADLGAGPGTASIALLLYILGLPREAGETLPAIEMDWFDTNEDIMLDGKNLVEQFASSFPKLRGKVQLRLHTSPWWKAPDAFPAETSLVFVGHVFNESTAPKTGAEAFWPALMEKAGGGGVLLVEPAARRSSQVLSQLRDGLFESGLIPEDATRMWGPCLHAQACPLSQGRDWCHFSSPITIPGKWFRTFSKSLSSERHWAKYSYLWFSSAEYPSPKPHPRMRRVISDPLSQGSQATLLLCEPETAGRISLPAEQGVGRGDMIRI